jgi:hypothetical protein
MISTYSRYESKAVSAILGIHPEVKTIGFRDYVCSGPLVRDEDFAAISCFIRKFSKRDGRYVQYFKVHQKGYFCILPENTEQDSAIRFWHNPSMFEDYAPKSLEDLTLIANLIAKTAEPMHEQGVSALTDLMIADLKEVKLPPETKPIN